MPAYVHWAQFMLNVYDNAPSSQPQEYAAAMANHILNHNVGYQARVEEEKSSDEENTGIAEVGTQAAGAHIPGLNNLGWKTCDEGEKAPSHHLHNASDVTEAFNIAQEMMLNKRQTKPVFLKVKHLNPNPVLSNAAPTKKKTDGNQATDLAYCTELTLVKEHLSKCCEQDHIKPDTRWCWLNPDTLEHVSPDSNSNSKPAPKFKPLASNLKHR
ncbi:hypothetical protein H1R20_g11421, partial [Candolleomyces eurysporus]